MLARLRDGAGEFGAAEDAYFEALVLAQAQSRNDLVAEASAGLMFIGGNLHRFDEAHRWEKLAKASLERAGLAGQEQEARFLSGRPDLRVAASPGEVVLERPVGGGGGACRPPMGFTTTSFGSTVPTPRRPRALRSPPGSRYQKAPPRESRSISSHPLPTLQVSGGAESHASSPSLSWFSAAHG